MTEGRSSQESRSYQDIFSRWPEEDKQREQERLARAKDELIAAETSGIFMYSPTVITKIQEKIHQADRAFTDTVNMYDYEALDAYQSLVDAVNRTTDQRIKELAIKANIPTDELNGILHLRQKHTSARDLIVFFSSPVINSLRQRAGELPRTGETPTTKENSTPLKTLAEAMTSGTVIEDLKAIALSGNVESPRARKLLEGLAKKPQYPQLRQWVERQLSAKPEPTTPSPTPTVPATPKPTESPQPKPPQPQQDIERHNARIEREQIERHIESLEAELRKPAPTVQVIADIHGSHNELLQTIDQYAADYGPASKLIFLGDFIDRGPDSFAVLDTVKGLVEDGKASFTLGNHEAMMIASILEGSDYAFGNWMPNGGDSVIRQAGVAGRDPSSARRNPTLKKWAEWLYQHGHIRLYKDRHLYVHAGVPLNADGTLAKSYNNLTGVSSLDAMETDLRSGTLKLAPWFAGERSPLFAAADNRDWEWYGRVANVDTLFNELNVPRETDDQLIRLVHGHSPTTRDGGNYQDGSFTSLVRSYPEWHKKILGIDAGMARDYFGRGGSLYLDQKGIQFKPRIPADHETIIDNTPRTINHTDRGRDINRQIAQLRQRLRQLPT